MWLKVKLLDLHKEKDVFHFMIIFSFFVVVTGLPQSLATTLKIAPRLTLSDRLQAAGEQDLCSTSRSSVDPVTNQAGSQWRIETKGKGHQKEGYVSMKKSLNMIYFLSLRHKSSQLVATTPSRGQSP